MKFPRSRSFHNGAVLFAVAVVATLFLSHPTKAKCSRSFGVSPLSSIPTHHGIDAAVHLSGGGGAVTKRRNQKKKRVASRRDTTPIISTSYSLLGKSDTNEMITVTTDLKNVSTWMPQPSSDSLSPMAITYMALLAIQFGVQPILVKRYTPPTIVKSSVVLVQEVVKFVIAGIIYWTGTDKKSRTKDLQDWSIQSWMSLACLPAILYTIQNISSLMAYQNLDALTFNVLNQTKILSAALFCYLIMGKQQSKMQVLSLALLTLSTLVIEKIIHPYTVMSLLSFRHRGRESMATLGRNQILNGLMKSLGTVGEGTSRRFSHGIVPIFVASLISGLAGALTQRILQGGGSSTIPFTKKKSIDTTCHPLFRPPRNAYLFSMEMNAASILLLLVSLLLSSNGKMVLSTSSFFSNWTPMTFLPVLTNAIGGILVGLVTKHAGSVRKGFALIFGLLLSGILQANGSGIRSEQVVGGFMAALSLWLHTVHTCKPSTAAVSTKKHQ